jgi:recombination protein RecT
MNEMTTINPLKQALTGFEKQISTVSQQLAASLPSHISIDKFQRTLMAAVKADPELLKADRASLVNACEKAALDGLLPDKREAALVIFKRNFKDAQGNWQQALEVAYMPMVYGLRKKILQSGEVADITSKVVYRREVEEGAFIYEEGTEAMLRHRPLLDLNEEDAKDENIVAVYSMATYKDGLKSYEVMRRFEVDKVRECSQTGATRDRRGQPRKASGPWVEWYPEQAKKTAMRRHSKTLPMSGDLMIDVEGRELELSANSTARMLAVEPDAPVALPAAAAQPEPKQTLSEALDDEIPTNFDKQTGEIIDEPARDAATGMTEVSEEEARALDAGQGNDGTLADDNPTAAEGPADEQRGEPEPDDKPAWWGKVQWIRSAVGAAKNKQQVKDVDDEFSRIRAGLPDEVIEELDALIAGKRRALTKTAEG